MLLEPISHRCRSENAKKIISTRWYWLPFLLYRLEKFSLQLCFATESRAWVSSAFYRDKNELKTIICTVEYIGMHSDRIPLSHIASYCSNEELFCYSFLIPQMPFQCWPINAGITFIWKRANNVKNKEFIGAKWRDSHASSETIRVEIHLASGMPSFCAVIQLKVCRYCLNIERVVKVKRKKQDHIIFIEIIEFILLKLKWAPSMEDKSLRNSANEILYDS